MRLNFVGCTKSRATRLKLGSIVFWNKGILLVHSWGNVWVVPSLVGASLWIASVNCSWIGNTSVPVFYESVWEWHGVSVGWKTFCQKVDLDCVCIKDLRVDTRGAWIIWGKISKSFVYSQRNGFSRGKGWILSETYRAFDTYQRNW